MRKLEANRTRVFIVGVKANKHQITQAGKKLRDIDGAKVSTLIGLVERRRHRFHWLLTMVLWMLPAKWGSSTLSPAG